MGDPRLKSRPSFQAFCYNANSDSFVFRLAKLKQLFERASISPNFNRITKKNEIEKKPQLSEFVVRHAHSV